MENNLENNGDDNMEINMQELSLNDLSKVSMIKLITKMNTRISVLEGQHKKVKKLFKFLQLQFKEKDELVGKLAIANEHLKKKIDKLKRNNSSLSGKLKLREKLILGQEQEKKKMEENYEKQIRMPGPGVVTIYFQTPFSVDQTDIHFRVIPGTEWTKPPGMPMVESTNSSYPSSEWSMYCVHSDGLEFVFNNGEGQWIHSKSGQNFLVKFCGIYAIDKDLNVKTIKTYGEKCKNNCSGHGICQKDGTCKCDPLYYMDDCSKKCDPGEIVCEEKCYKGKTCPIHPLPGCEIYADGKCNGDEINMPTDFFKRRWQTPVSGSVGYEASYQSFSHLQGYAHVIYDSSHKSATVEIKTFTKDSNPSDLVYSFDGKEESSAISKFDSSYSKILEISVKDKVKGYMLNLPEVDFLWNIEPIASREGDYREGQKGAVVEFFGWPDTDIEKECEVLSKAGYLGAKIFPHMEQLMSQQPFNNDLNPWYFMYQPVSYKLDGRMGTRDDLRQLIRTCRKLGVRVYHDAVNNHMTGSGNDIQSHRNSNGGTCTYWPGKNTSSPDSSPYYTQGFCFEENRNTNLPPSEEYPAVPWSPLDFHCERPLNSWTSPLDLNAGWLVGLVDLHTGVEYVQERIAQYWVDLLGIGFSGFRLDAFKHIEPDDMIAIVKKFKTYMGGVLPKDFFFWGEVLVGGEHEMLLCNEHSGYNFGPYLTKGFQKAGFTDDEILKLKIWSSFYPKEPEADCNQIDRRREVIQNDDHDQQNPGGSTSRDMGDKGTVLVIAKNIPLHRQFETILFDSPFDVHDNDNEWPIRAVLSSYWFTAKSGSTAIPDGKSDCKNCRITCEGCNSVQYSPAFNESACGYDGLSGGNPYTRVHRDRSIILSMRRWMHLPTDVSNKEIGIPDGCK